MTEYEKRKEDRRKEYNKYHGAKEVECTACSGFGSYKNGPCGQCDGKGKTREIL